MYNHVKFKFKRISQVFTGKIQGLEKNEGMHFNVLFSILAAQTFCFYLTKAPGWWMPVNTLCLTNTSLAFKGWIDLDFKFIGIVLYFTCTVQMCLFELGRYWTPHFVLTWLRTCWRICCANTRDCTGIKPSSSNACWFFMAWPVSCICSAGWLKSCFSVCGFCFLIALYFVVMILYF